MPYTVTMSNVPDTSLTNDQIRSLESEARILREDELATAKRVFKQHLPQMAATICNIALHSPSERTRLSAAQYAIDRIMGKPSDKDTASADPMVQFLEQMHEISEKEREAMRASSKETPEPEIFLDTES